MFGGRAAELVSVLLTVLVFIISLLVQRVDSLGCFVCSSINNSDPLCDDPFNNTGKYYHGFCESGRPDRVGLFPATSCIKMKAEIPDTGHTVLVRACVVDNGGTNSETEIGRINHCGLVHMIKFKDAYMRGCIEGCQTNGCNSARGLRGDVTFVSVSLVSTLIFSLFTSR